MPSSLSEADPRGGDGPAAARPYGWFGLVASTLVILVLAAAILLLLAAAGFAIAAAFAGWRGALARLDDLRDLITGGDDAADRVNVVVGGIAYVVTACSVLIVARFRGGRRWADLVAWRPWDMRRHARLLTLLLVATVGWSLLASAAIEQVHPEAKDWVSTPTGTPWIIAFLALATLFAPITEELLFRGWIFTSLRPKIGARFAILVSAVLFAVAHWESTHLYALAVFPVGLALGYVRQKTDSVAASITFHALYNGVASVLLFVGK